MEILFLLQRRLISDGTSSVKLSEILKHSCHSAQCYNYLSSYLTSPQIINSLNARMLYILHA